MSAARTAILARLTSAQRTAELPASPVVSALKPTPRDTAECVERFRQELRALAVDCRVEESAEAVRGRVRELTEGKRILAWDAEHLPYDVASVVAGAISGRAPREAQAQAEVGVTGCLTAIAETGSLALVSGPGRSRAVSLLPPVHLAVVRRADLVFSMGEFFRGRGAELDAAASCTFVTGPSRTADIELTLTLGVHGPGRVVVVVGP